jgi:hypothetical protein
MWENSLLVPVNRPLPSLSQSLPGFIVEDLRALASLPGQGDWSEVTTSTHKG